MYLDLSQDIQRGWIACVGVVVVSAIALYVVWDGGISAEQVATEAAAIETGSGDLENQVAKARAANRELAATIKTLTEKVGFNTEDAFQVANEEVFKRQPEYFFVTKRDAIIGRLLKRAQEKGIREYEEYGGFGVAQHRPPGETLPPPEAALDLLRMLQITEKAVSICLETPTPLEKLLVKPHGSVHPVDVAAPGRPVVLQEYRLTLVVRGSLRDILWILHRLSPGRDAPNADYPLVLKSLKITSDNRSPIDAVQFLDCEMTVAGMRFLSDDERAKTAPDGVVLRSSSRSAAPVAARSF